MTSNMQRTLAVILGLLCFTPAHADKCSAILEISFPDVQMLEATQVDAPAPHCKAKGRIGRDIHFSVWLPDDWNGRFVMGGAGGFVREEDNQAIRFLGPSVLTRGYATASTDTGHQGDGRSNDWGYHNYEAIVNYAYLAMHRAVVSAKAVIADHYGKAAEKSFFIGCSNGGRQALHEAQRYPNDFDAIVAGAPALNFSGVAGAFLDITQRMYPNPGDLTTPLVSKSDRAFLRTALERECDALDGQTDGIISDPTACTFDPGVLQCKAGAETNCLTAEKIAAIKAVYAGPHDSKGQIFFGFPFGAENIDSNGWGMWLTGGAASGPPSAAWAFGMGIMRNFVFHDQTWTYRNYNWDSFRDQTAAIASLIDAKNPDLSAFRAQGGKLLMFHGWADVALTAHMSTDYIEQVWSQDGAAREDTRLYMMPGVLHCARGPGPSYVDWLNVVETWHDSGIPPETLVAHYPSGGEASGARLLCPWPQKQVYVGGPANEPGSYTCVAASAKAAAR